MFSHIKRRSFQFQQQNFKKKQNWTKIFKKSELILKILTFLNSEYLNMNKNVTSKNNRCKKFFKKLRLKQNLMLLLTIYNLVYMPIQMAFRIPFEGIFLGLECLTIVAYVFDIGWRAHKLRKLLRIHSISDRKLRLKDRKLKRDTELLKQTISTQRTEVIMTAIAITCTNCITSTVGITYTVLSNYIISVNQLIPI